MQFLQHLERHMIYYSLKGYTKFLGGKHEILFQKKMIELYKFLIKIFSFPNFSCDTLARCEDTSSVFLEQT